MLTPSYRSWGVRQAFSAEGRSFGGDNPLRPLALSGWQGSAVLRNPGKGLGGHSGRTGVAVYRRPLPPPRGLPGRVFGKLLFPACSSASQEASSTMIPSPEVGRGGVIGGRRSRGLHWGCWRLHRELWEALLESAAPGKRGPGWRRSGSEARTGQESHERRGVGSSQARGACRSRSRAREPPTTS